MLIVFLLRIMGNRPTLGCFFFWTECLIFRNKTTDLIKEVCKKDPDVSETKGEFRNTVEVHASHFTGMKGTSVWGWVRTWPPSPTQSSVP